MEEPNLPVTEGETPAPSASETESAPEAETSEAATSEQPVEEATASEAPPSRAKERITKLAAERDYWRDLAQPALKPEASEEDGEMTVDEVAKRTAEETVRSIRAEEAQKAMVKDAYAAIEKYPELDTDDDLSADVLALARGRGISITAAADRLIGQTKANIQKTSQARGSAEASVKAGAAAPQSKKVSTGEAPPIDLKNMSEEDKQANWDEIVSRLASR